MTTDRDTLAALLHEHELGCWYDDVGQEHLEDGPRNCSVAMHRNAADRLIAANVTLAPNTDRLDEAHALGYREGYRAALAATPEPTPAPPAGYAPLTAEEQITLIRRSLAEGLVLDRFAGSVPLFHHPATPEPTPAGLDVESIVAALRRNQHGPDVVAREPLAGRWNAGIDRAIGVVLEYARLATTTEPQATEDRQHYAGRTTQPWHREPQTTEDTGGREPDDWHHPCDIPACNCGRCHHCGQEMSWDRP